MCCSSRKLVLLRVVEQMQGEGKRGVGGGGETFCEMESWFYNCLKSRSIFKCRSISEGGKGTKCYLVSRMMAVSAAQLSILIHIHRICSVSSC